MEAGGGAAEGVRRQPVKFGWTAGLGMSVGGVSKPDLAGFAKCVRVGARLQDEVYATNVPTGRASLGTVLAEADDDSTEDAP